MRFVSRMRRMEMEISHILDVAKTLLSEIKVSTHIAKKTVALAAGFSGAFAL